jgi:hypothetical protein
MPKPEIGSLCVYIANYSLHVEAFTSARILFDSAPKSNYLDQFDLFFIISITEDNTNQIKMSPRLIEEGRHKHKMLFVITSKNAIGWINLYSYEYRII